MNIVRSKNIVFQVGLLFLLVIGVSNSMNGQISENFQLWSSKVGYSGALSQNGAGGIWSAIDGAVIVAPTGVASGTGSSGYVQIASGFNYALVFPNISSGGIGTVSIQARASSASGASFTIEKNVNGGVWSTIATFSSVSTTATLYQAIVNDASANIQLRISNSSSNRALYLHDISTTTSCNYGSIIGISGSSVNHPVISQIYGGGGLAASGSIGAATFKSDFVELFNPTNAPILLSGYSLQYAAASGVNWEKNNLLGTIASGGYFLIKLFSDSAGNGVSLPTPDFTPINPIDMANDSGKIALINNQILITSGLSYPPQSSIIDFVGYGVANSFEGNAAAPQLTRILADFRNNSGCVDTDNNLSDFSVATPNPRNSSSPANSCIVNNTNTETVCSGGVPSQMKVTGAAGSGSFSYQWYSRSGIIAAPSGTSTTDWTSLGTSNGANTNIYTPPAAITSSTTYACFVTSSGTPTCGSGAWASGVRQITVTPSSSLGFVNLQFPASGAICSSGSFTAYGRVWLVGVTPGPGAGAGIKVQFGYSSSNSNPSTWNTWFTATYNTDTDFGNNDEYQYTLNSLPAGTYYYAFRYSNSTCNWQYGGYNISGGGTWDGTSNLSGILTVSGIPTTAAAGPDHTVCEGTAITLAANTPAVGTGQWSIISGSGGTITTIANPTSTFTGTINTTYTLRWTTTNGTCTSTSDDVLIRINGINYANLQSPQSGSMCLGGTYNVYGRVYVAGLTEAAGTGTGIVAELGYSPVNTNSNPNSWTNWIATSFNNIAVNPGNNDEYMATLSGLSAGTYYYAFRYSLNGCSVKYGGTNGIWNNDSGVLTVYGIPTTAIAGPDQTTCNKSMLTLAANIPTVGTGQWSISSGPNLNTSQFSNLSSNSSGFTPTNNGTYTLVWTISNGSCVSSTSSIQINVNNIDWANTQWPPNASICSNGSLPVFGQIYVAGLTEAYEQGAGIVAQLGYSPVNTNSDPSTWTNWIPASINLNSLINPNNDEYMATLSGLSSGTYYYAFRYSLNGCPYKYGGNLIGNWNQINNQTGGFWDRTTYISGVLTVNQPNVTISGITTICSGSSTTLTASGANTYLWSNGSTATSITVSPTNLTTYTVTGTDSNNCTNTANINITVNPKPISTLIYHD